MALVHIDAGVVVGFRDADDAHHDATRVALEGVLGAGDRIEMAASAFAAAVVCAVQPKLRLPDALVVATAAERGADQLITTDRKWRSARAPKLGADIVEL